MVMSSCENVMFIQLKEDIIIGDINERKSVFVFVCAEIAAAGSV